MIRILKIIWYVVWRSAVAVVAFVFSAYAVVVLTSEILNRLKFNDPNSTVRTCLEFPNGLLYAQEGMAKNPFRGPESVLYAVKLPNGEVLNTRSIRNFYVTETTFFGKALEKLNPTDRDGFFYNFAYRPDIGYIIRDVDPERFERVIAEAGEPVLVAEDPRETLFIKYREFHPRLEKFIQTGCETKWTPVNARIFFDELARWREVKRQCIARHGGNKLKCEGSIAWKPALPDKISGLDSPKS